MTWSSSARSTCGSAIDEQQTVTGNLAKELGCESGTAWLRISSLRMVGDDSNAPIGWTDVYIDPAYADIADLVKENPDTLISALLEERYDRHIAEIHQDIRAFTVADPAMAAALRIEIGASALKIVRRYLDASGDAFEVSVSVHPAERFSISMKLQRSPT